MVHILCELGLGYRCIFNIDYRSSQTTILISILFRNTDFWTFSLYSQKSATFKFTVTVIFNIWNCFTTNLIRSSKRKIWRNIENKKCYVSQPWYNLNENSLKLSKKVLFPCIDILITWRYQYNCIIWIHYR